MFLDVYCIDYPEIWVKVEKNIMSKNVIHDIDSICTIVKHMSNQHEGSDILYDHIEKILTVDIDKMNDNQLIVVYMLIRLDSHSVLLQREERDERLHGGGVQVHQ